ncbi:MAG: nucleotidyltransferase domain-containing protein [Actinomycetota bacterium]|nr:nucleotidyltransferase domain-containing protein [Actinomycetota bacterium]
MSGDVLAERQRERERLIALARTYVERLGRRTPVVAAAVAGSVARGDFNVWSDVDVVVVVQTLPARLPDRAALLAADAPGGVQGVGYTEPEFDRELRRGNPLVKEAVASGVILAGEEFFRGRAHILCPPE